jgi:iron complex outermembrane receptor protein
VKIIITAALALLSVHAFSQDQKDSLATRQLDEVVVTGSRSLEDIYKSPVTVEKTTRKAFQQSPAPSFFDGLDFIKGVQLITPSLGFKVINTRGFANTTNVRFVQLVDGTDVQAPHIGAPIANMMGPSDLDLESTEIVPGVASALYGMNAINGLANFTSLDPFQNTGLSIQQKVGVNNVSPSDGNKLYSETALRWAQKTSDRFAYKINATYMRGYDFVANNLTDINPNANATTGLLGADNPALDPVNSYGNESSDRRTINLNGKNYVVARTGYLEKEVVDYTLKNMKADATLVYKIRPQSRLSYTYRFADINNVYQRANRFRLEDYILQQHAITYQDANLLAHVYVNLENTGKSYNARSMAENIDRTFKPDNQWYADYSSRFTSAVNAGSTVAEAHHLARATADQGRPIPGTEEFSNMISQLRNINNWDYGAALRVKSQMYHGDIQYDLSGVVRNYIHLLTGGDYRSYVIVPDGNYFINPEEPGKNLVYYKYGAFVEATKTLWNDKLKIGATLRADKNQYYDVKWNPRFTVVYSPGSNQSLRFSFQSGYRFPSVFEAFSNINSGGVKRVGGLPVMSHGIFENSYLRASVDAFQAAVTKDVNTNGTSVNQAIANNQGLLKKNGYTYLQPEHIQSFEAGYRGVLFKNLKVDIDVYFNQYNDFIAQVEVNVPKTTIADSIPYYMNNKAGQDKYRMWTNSMTVAYNYGSSVGLSYKFYKEFVATGNATYAVLQHRTSGDGLEDGFNTPKWMYNVSIGNSQLFNRVGVMVNYRWQTAYYWQSFLVNGNVPSFGTLNAQVNWKMLGLTWKCGATNLTNTHYYSYLGGPSIGGMYYVSLTYGLK